MVTCIVEHHRPFGMLVKIKGSTLIGIIERIGMGHDGYRTPEDYPPIQSEISALVIGFRDYCREVELRLPRKKAEN